MNSGKIELPPGYSPYWSTGLQAGGGYRLKLSADKQNLEAEIFIPGWLNGEPMDTKVTQDLQMEIHTHIKNVIVKFKNHTKKLEKDMKKNGKVIPVNIISGEADADKT